MPRSYAALNTSEAVVSLTPPFCLISAAIASASGFRYSRRAPFGTLNASPTRSTNAFSRLFWMRFDFSLPAAVPGFSAFAFNCKPSPVAAAMSGIPFMGGSITPGVSASAFRRAPLWAVSPATGGRKRPPSVAFSPDCGTILSRDVVAPPIEAGSPVTESVLMALAASFF